MRHVTQGAGISVLVSLPPARKAPVPRNRKLDWGVAAFWVFALFNVVTFWSMMACIALGYRAWAMNVLDATGLLWVVASLGAFVYWRRRRSRPALLG